MGWRHKRELEEINCDKTDEEVQVQVPWVTKQIQEGKRHDADRAK